MHGWMNLIQVDRTSIISGTTNSGPRWHYSGITGALFSFSFGVCVEKETHLTASCCEVNEESFDSSNPSSCNTHAILWVSFLFKTVQRDLLFNLEKQHVVSPGSRKIY